MYIFQRLQGIVLTLDELPQNERLEFLKALDEKYCFKCGKIIEIQCSCQKQIKET
jgi:hypothetical protein